MLSGISLARVWVCNTAPFSLCRSARLAIECCKRERGESGIPVVLNTDYLVTRTSRALLFIRKDQSAPRLAILYKLFQKELYKSERVYKFIRRTYTTF
jgi:hypothetical protein